MRWLILYFRQCFCKHEFQISERPYELKDGWGGSKNGVKVDMLCKKCGYHKSHKKYGW